MPDDLDPTTTRMKVLHYASDSDLWGEVRRRNIPVESSGSKPTLKTSQRVQSRVRSLTTWLKPCKLREKASRGDRI